MLLLVIFQSVGRANDLSCQNRTDTTKSNFWICLSNINILLFTFFSVKWYSAKDQTFFWLTFYKAELTALLSFSLSIE